MSVSQDYALNRAQDTRSAQTAVIEKWEWWELDLEGWDSQINAFKAQQQVASQAEASMLAIRGNLDSGLSELHTRTVQGVTMARVRYRDDPASLAIVNRLSADGQYRDDIFSQAVDWESAWTTLDPAWAPMKDCPLETFKALRMQCLTLDDAYSLATASWRSAAEELNKLTSELHGLNVGWYASATAVFAAGTPEGDMIRGTIDTLGSSSSGASNKTSTATVTPTPVSAQPTGTSATLTSPASPANPTGSNGSSSSPSSPAEPTGANGSSSSPAYAADGSSRAEEPANASGNSPAAAAA